MKVPYHRAALEVDLEIGDLVNFTTIAGRKSFGTVLGVDYLPWPRNITYLRVLTGVGEERVNTNLIFRMWKM